MCRLSNKLAIGRYLHSMSSNSSEKLKTKPEILVITQIWHPLEHLLFIFEECARLVCNLLRSAFRLVRLLKELVKIPGKFDNMVKKHDFIRTTKLSYIVKQDSYPFDVKLIEVLVQPFKNAFDELTVR